MEKKLNAYIGYVVPILTYASQVWYPSKTDMKSIERIQHKATKWICGGKDEYHQRLEILKILPLSMYMEMHDVLYLLAILVGNYYVPEDKVPYAKIKQDKSRNLNSLNTDYRNQTKTSSSEPQSYTSSEEQRRNANDEETSDRDLPQNYFHRSYNELDSCTWRLLCNWKSAIQ